MDNNIYEQFSLFFKDQKQLILASLVIAVFLVLAIYIWSRGRSTPKPTKFSYAKLAHDNPIKTSLLAGLITGIIVSLTQLVVKSDAITYKFSRALHGKSFVDTFTASQSLKVLVAAVMLVTLIVYVVLALELLCEKEEKK